MAKKEDSTKREANQGLVEVKMPIGVDEYGKPIRMSFYGQSKKKARQKGDQYKLDLALKGGEIEKEVKFETWARKWLEVYKENDVRNVTYEYTYKQPLENHVIPYFEGRRLKDILPLHIKEFLKSKNDFSYTMLSKFRLVLYSVFETAVSNNIITKNPTKGIRLSKTSTDRVTEKRAYAKEQARTVIEYAKTHKYGADIIIMLKTGLRRSELLALKWTNIDLENKIIHVKESVSESNGIIKLNPCKTKKSIRDIPFDDELAAVLNGIPKRTSFKVKKITVEHEFVISGKFGTSIKPNNWTRRHFEEFMADFAKAHPEVPALLSHELRHSFGSILYANGVDIVTISKLMGHSSIDITVKLYVHDDMDLMQKAIANGV